MTNHTARALALVAARRHFEGIHVWPTDDAAADEPYWQALRNVRRELYAAGYAAHLVHFAAVRGLGALRKERAQQQQETTP